MKKNFKHNYLSLPESLITVLRRSVATPMRVGQSRERIMGTPIIDCINSGYDKRGFTLIELSIVMVIVAMLLSFSLSAFSTVHDSQAAKLNREKIQMVQDAIEEYVAENGFLPCVADRSLVPGDINFGTASCTATIGTYTTGAIWVGGVPVKELAIPESLSYDAYGYRFTYAVTDAHTDITTYSTDPAEVIVVDIAGNDVTTSGDKISYLVVSHGKTSKGGFNHRSGDLKACVVGTKDEENCNADDTFRDMALNTGSVAANFYDDSIRWASKTLPVPPSTGITVKITPTLITDGDDIGGTALMTEACQAAFGPDAYMVSYDELRGPYVTFDTNFPGAGWFTGGSVESNPLGAGWWISGDCLGWTSDYSPMRRAYQVTIGGVDHKKMGREYCSVTSAIACAMPTP